MKIELAVIIAKRLTSHILSVRVQYAWLYDTYNCDRLLPARLPLRFLKHYCLKTSLCCLEQGLQNDLILAERLHEKGFVDYNPNTFHQ